MKACNDCSVTKPLTAFARDKSLSSGRRGKCRACTARADRAYNARLENMARRKEVRQRWRCTPAGRASERRGNNARRYSGNNLLKARVRNKLRYAVKAGKVDREPCCLCDATPAHGHHDDYNKPLDVTWLCGPCHVAYHAGWDALKPTLWWMGPEVAA